MKKSQKRKTDWLGPMPDQPACMLDIAAAIRGDVNSVVAEFETTDGNFYRIEKDTYDRYHVYYSCEDRIVQRNHDAEGIIHWMANYIHNLKYVMSKVEAQNTKSEDNK